MKKNNYCKNVGKRLQKYRKKAGFTQESFAEYLDISYRAVSNLENGICFPQGKKFPKIEKGLNISLGDLFDECSH